MWYLAAAFYMFSGKHGGVMDVKELPAGEMAPPDSDKIKVSKTPSGAFMFAGNVQTSENGVIFHHIAEFSTYAGAKEAGKTWAKGNHAHLLYIENDDA
jgi:hypothetical protein